jgi:hypothetical protein
VLVEDDKGSTHSKAAKKKSSLEYDIVSRCSLVSAAKAKSAWPTKLLHVVRRQYCYPEIIETSAIK